MRGEERGKFENWLINARAPQSQKGRGQQKSNEDFSLHSVEGGFLALLSCSLLASIADGVLRTAGGRGEVEVEGSLNSEKCAAGGGGGGGSRECLKLCPEH